MNRYFIEVAYLGRGYAGFQVQDNAVTIQSEVEKALGIFLKKRIVLTGSSRTDTDVHAEQNYFHFDLEESFPEEAAYNINALLPPAVAVKRIQWVESGSHCRFDAISRQYRYEVYRHKDPFMNGRGYYFPYALDIEVMRECAVLLMAYEEFGSFAKRNSQVSTFSCHIGFSDWTVDGEKMVYRVRSNRFLRGMVRGLVGTMLKVGRGRMGVEEFRRVVERGDASGADFSVPGWGLYLEKVEFRDGYFGG